MGLFFVKKKCFRGEVCGEPHKSARPHLSDLPSGFLLGTDEGPAGGGTGGKVRFRRCSEAEIEVRFRLGPYPEYN